MLKVTTREGVGPAQKFDELRRLANTEYFDIMLLHWQHTATWPTDTARWQDQSSRSSRGKSCSATERPFMACPRCAGFQETRGSTSR